MPAQRFAIAGELEVERIGYGGMALTGPGGWGEPRDKTRAVEVLRRAVELGVTLIDTADSYGPQASELLVADALHPYQDEVVIATKGGFERTGPWQLHPAGRPEHLRSACEGSLRRLRVERIDVYQLHTVDPAVPLEESVGALGELRGEGKIAHIGLSNVSAHEIDRARAVTRVASVQNRYSLAERPAGEDSVIEVCERNGIVYLPWHPLAGGALSRGRKALRRVAARLDATPAQVALAWLLHRSPVIVPIPGTLDPAHLQANVAALDLELADSDLADLDTYRPPVVTARGVAKRLAPAPVRHVAGGLVRRRASG